MHEATRDRLEELLSGNSGTSSFAAKDGAAAGNFHRCPACDAEVASMRQHSVLLKELCPPAETDGELEPRPGFYARVLQRIEQSAQVSIWYGLAYSRLGRRVAYASLSFALALGVYVAAVERSDMASAWLHAPSHTVTEVSGAPNADAQRDAVLVNLTSYSGQQP